VVIINRKAILRPGGVTAVGWGGQKAKTSGVVNLETRKKRELKKKTSVIFE